MTKKTMCPKTSHMCGRTNMQCTLYFTSLGFTYYETEIATVSFALDNLKLARFVAVAHRSLLNQMRIVAGILLHD